MKKWKAITLDYNELSIFDTESYNHVCLNQRQVAILLALLIPARWTTRWINLGVTGDVIEAEIDEIEYRLQGNDCECEYMEYRQNPLDLCEVQYRQNNVSEWQTMFRLDVCQPLGTGNSCCRASDYNDYVTNVTNYINNYNTTIADIAPKWDATQGNISRALCAAIKSFVNAMCDNAINMIAAGNQERRDANNWIDDLTDLFSSEAISLLLAFPGPHVLLEIGAVAVSWAIIRLMNGLADYLLLESDEAFKDFSARDAVACHIYRKMRGITPRHNIWAASLDDFDGATENETIIANYLKIPMSDLDVFLSYMVYMEDINDSPEYLPDCDCPEVWELLQLGGYGTVYTSPNSEDITVDGDTPVVAPAVYDESNDWYMTILSGAGFQVGNIEVIVPTDVQILTIDIDLRYDREAGTIIGDKNCGVFMNDEYVGGVTLEFAFGTNKAISINLIHQVNTLLPVTDRVRIHTSLDREIGQVRVVGIRMTGVVI